MIVPPRLARVDWRLPARIHGLSSQNKSVYTSVAHLGVVSLLSAERIGRCLNLSTWLTVLLLKESGLTNVDAEYCGRFIVFLFWFVFQLGLGCCGLGPSECKVQCLELC